MDEDGLPLPAAIVGAVFGAAYWGAALFVRGMDGTGMGLFALAWIASALTGLNSLEWSKFPDEDLKKKGPFAQPFARTAGAKIGAFSSGLMVSTVLGITVSGGGAVAFVLFGAIAAAGIAFPFANRARYNKARARIAEIDAGESRRQYEAHIAARQAQERAERAAAEAEAERERRAAEDAENKRRAMGEQIIRGLDDF